MKLSKSYLNDIIYHVNGAAIEVHKHLGPGMLESVYHLCLKHELDLRGIKFESEMLIPIGYKGLEFDATLKCDLFVEDILVVELKSVSELLPIHQAQIMSYMNLLGVPKGLLLNFNVVNIFKHGQKTVVNALYRDLED